jgi:hypothetical protein
MDGVRVSQMDRFFKMETRRAAPDGMGAALVYGL